jgi:hypothetical protein
VHPVYRGYVTEPRHDKRKNIRRSKELGGLQPAIIGVNLCSTSTEIGTGSIQETGGEFWQ